MIARRLRLACAAAVRPAAAAIALGAQSQMASPPPPQQPTFRVEANYVRVDAYPTLDGQPVSDLTAEDFEIFEDGVPQKVAAFERVVVRPAGPQTERVEPNTVREANAMAADPRSRVFVLFLDTSHVDVGGSHDIQQPLIRLLDRIIGQDDLVGVMTPEISASNLVLGRRMMTIEGMLTRAWTWGRRDQRSRDPQEQRYEICYGANDPVALEMIDRKREKQALDALVDLVHHLNGLREERKAIIAITTGWTLFKPNLQLARPVTGKGQGVPGTPQVRVGERGVLTTADDRSPGGATQYECDSHRIQLAHLDNDEYFRRILDEANRANASFYPVDPRGLVVFDSPIDKKVSLSADQASLRRRNDSLRTLASVTDGIAIVNQTDIDGALKRIVDDLTSYYLLGYYSTNSKLDGRFRSIKVRVTRPGVQVRARRGYRAPTAEEVTSARRDAEPARGGAAPNPGADAVRAGLNAIRPEAMFRAHVGYAWARSPAEGATLWVVGELDFKALKSPDWQGGGTAEVTLVRGAKEVVATATASIAAGARAFTLTLPQAGVLDPGDYTVRVRVRSPTGVLPVSDVARVSIDPEVGAGTILGQPLVLRRGPSTGLKYEPTADLRFRRSERIRVEAPSTPPGGTVAGRLLNQIGQALEVPVAVIQRPDSSGAFDWAIGDVALAPLAAGDYGIELTVERDGDMQRIVTAFRIVP